LLEHLLHIVHFAVNFPARFLYRPAILILSLVLDFIVLNCRPKARLLHKTKKVTSRAEFLAKAGGLQVELGPWG
jgi:hypothetical protein